MNELVHYEEFAWIEKVVHGSCVNLCTGILLVFVLIRKGLCTLRVTRGCYVLVFRLSPSIHRVHVAFYETLSLFCFDTNRDPHEKLFYLKPILSGHFNMHQIIVITKLKPFQSQSRALFEASIKLVLSKSHFYYRQYILKSNVYDGS